MSGAKDANGAEEARPVRRRIVSAFDWLRTDGVSFLVRPGRGGTVVIIPGAMSDAQAWQDFAGALETPSTIVIVNRRGRSPSGDLPAGSTVAAETEELLPLLARMEGPFVLFGWSYGGLVALEVAKVLQTIASLVLYEPVCRPFAPGAIEAIRSSVIIGDLDLAVAQVLTRVSGLTSPQVAALRSTPAWNDLRRLVAPTPTELEAIERHEPDTVGYARIKAQISILVGSLSEGHAPYGTAAERFAGMLPQARKIVLVGQGHLAHVDAPRTLAGAVGALAWPEPSSVRSQK